MNKQWLNDAIFYQIYPQSFRDTNADGIGDINGIIEKLDYIKEVGFNAIWINPCYDSPFRDAGYDVTDYYNTAPRYGTNEDMKRLFDEVHKRDMHILLDLVPGHTSLECPWFIQSQKAEKNEYSGRYIWTDSIWKDIINVPGISGTLRGMSERNGSCAVNYFSCQPALNYGFADVTESWQSAVDSSEAIETRKAMIDIMSFWINMGCDGFRIDMAGSLVKNDQDQKETIRLWQDILGQLNKKFPGAVFVSEWGTPDRALQAGFDMDFLLHVGPTHYLDLFRTETPYFSHNGCGSLQKFFEIYISNIEKAGGQGCLCIPSGNHDMERISYKLDDTELKLAFAFLMSMPCVPFVYYGDEIGMRYLAGIKSVEGGFNRTGSRSPMQWDNSINCGFSSASPDKLYICMDDDENRPTVLAQLGDCNSVLNELKRIIAVRGKYEDIRCSGSFELLSSGYPLAFIRNEKVLVVINPTDTEKNLKLSSGVHEVIYSYGGEFVFKDSILTVPPCSAFYIKTEKQ